METSMKLYAFVVSLTILSLKLVAADMASEVLDESPKCMPPPAGIQIMADCFVQTMGKPLDMNMKSSQFSKDEKVQILMCAGKHLGMISEDGATFEVDKTVAAVDMLNADAAVKTALKAELKDCGGKATDGVTFMECFHDAFMKNCA